MKVARRLTILRPGLALLLAAGCLEEPRTTSNSGSGGRSQSGGATSASSGAPSEETGGRTTQSGGRQSGAAPNSGGSSEASGAGGDGGANAGASATSPLGGTDAGGAGGGPPSAPGGSGGEPSAGGEDSGGAGGEGPQTPAIECPESAVSGWASVAGLGFEGPTTGGSGAPIIVSTAEALVEKAMSPEPAVIVISGTIAVPVLNVTSNKTILGIDANATLQGGIRIAGTSAEPAAMVSNVIIKNLFIDALTADTSPDPDEDDAINITYAHHVWIDHVYMLNAPGDNLDIQRGSDYITVSWSTLDFFGVLRQPAARIGHSDANMAEDAGHLKVTFHHNWWADGVNQRMPRVRFGDVHVYNNYYSAVGNRYCIAAAYESRLLVENNYFDGSLNPHVFFSFVNGVDSFTEPTAEMVARGNLYLGDSDLAEGKLSAGASFEPPYVTVLEPVDASLRTRVRGCAGPR